MRAVRSYPLPHDVPVDRITIEMPANARVLGVGALPFQSVVWAFGDDAHVPEARIFVFYGDDQEIAERYPGGLEYVGTLPGASSAWHLFEVVQQRVR